MKIEHLKINNKYLVCHSDKECTFAGIGIYTGKKKQINGEIWYGFVIGLDDSQQNDPHWFKQDGIFQLSKSDLKELGVRNMEELNVQHLCSYIKNNGFDHNKYPIITGATYVNDEGETGILEAAELFTEKNDALIVINTKNRGRYYKLNYAMFTIYWKLL